MSSIRKFISIVEGRLDEDGTNWPALIASLIEKLPPNIQQQVFQVKEGAASLAEALSTAMPGVAYAIWDTLYMAIEGNPPMVNNGRITAEAGPTMMQEWQRFCQMCQKIAGLVKTGAAAPAAGPAPAAAPAAPSKFGR